MNGSDVYCQRGLRKPANNLAAAGSFVAECGACPKGGGNRKIVFVGGLAPFVALLAQACGVLPYCLKISPLSVHE